MLKFLLSGPGVFWPLLWAAAILALVFCIRLMLSPGPQTLRWALRSSLVPAALGVAIAIFGAFERLAFADSTPEQYWYMVACIVDGAAISGFFLAWVALASTRARRLPANPASGAA